MEPTPEDSDDGRALKNGAQDSLMCEDPMRRTLKRNTRQSFTYLEQTPPPSRPLRRSTPANRRQTPTKPLPKKLTLNPATPKGSSVTRLTLSGPKVNVSPPKIKLRINPIKSRTTKPLSLSDFKPDKGLFAPTLHESEKLSQLIRERDILLRDLERFEGDGWSARLSDVKEVQSFDIDFGSFHGEPKEHLEDLYQLLDENHVLRIELQVMLTHSPPLHHANPQPALGIHQDSPLT